jgi:hypothetical protein
MIKIWDIKILKYVKLITIHLKFCVINVLKIIKNIKNDLFQVLQLFTAVWIIHTNICIDHNIDLVQVEQMLCVVLGGEV